MGAAKGKAKRDGKNNPPGGKWNVVVVFHFVFNAFRETLCFST